MTESRPPPRRPYKVNVFRKLELVLYKDDGSEYDERGCLSQCLPAACQKPAYKSGELITGHLLVRPARRVVITGFRVTFGGRYKTHWTEAKQIFSTTRDFFLDTETIIQNRTIVLERKWYRFDFEYALPRGLPCSLKEPEGRVLYYGYASVTRPDGRALDTYDTHFAVLTPLDIDTLPTAYHEPCHRKRRKTLASAADDVVVSSVTKSHHDVRTDEQTTCGGDGDVSEKKLLSRENDSVIATLCLQNRAFIVGQHATVEFTIENNTSSALTCVLKFEQVVMFEADCTTELLGKGQEPLCRSEARSRATRKNATKPTDFRILPGAAEAISSTFVVPATLPASTPEEYHLSKANTLCHRHPLIKIKYYLTLEVQSPVLDEDILMPVEIKVGQEDSRGRYKKLEAACSSLDPSRSTSATSRWDATPSSDEAPPGYEEV